MDTLFLTSKIEIKVRLKGVVQELTKFYRMIEDGFGGYFIQPSEEGNKLERLFNQYMNSGLSEQEIQGHLYPKDSSKAFMMLRKELSNRLFRYVLAVDSKRFSSSKRVIQFINILKNAIAGRVLLFLGLYKSGLHLSKQTIKEAIEEEVWDVVFTLASVLSTFFSIRGNSQGFREYDELADFALQRISSERVLRKMINKWSLRYGRRRKATRDDIKELESDVREGDAIIMTTSTPNLLHFNYRLKLLYYDATMNYEQAILICNEARETLQSSQKNVDKGKLGIYHGTQMYCYLNLKKFEEASAFAEKLDEYFVVGTLNWYNITEYYFVLCIQTGRYDQAYDQLIKARRSGNHDQLVGVQAQVWSLFEGYMQFVISGGLWKNPSILIEGKNFKVARFLNEVVSLSGDKTGIHVSVLILQIMFLLQQGRYEDIIDRKDALRRYVYRYLYSKENERSRIFLNMLLRMIECDFSYSITKTKTQRLYKSLSEQQMNYQANLGGNEIVDYEVLWNWTLDTIKGSLTWKSAAAS